MSLKSTATVNEPLTSYAYGLMQDRLKVYELANVLCPIVQVGAATGTYKVYDDRNAFFAPDTARALGGARNRIQANASDGTYTCKPQALSIALDDYELSLASTRNSPADLAQLKIKTLLSQKATAYSKRVTDFVFANLTAVSDRGNWTNDTVDPLDQLDEQLDALSGDVGSTENIVVVMGVAEWRKLRANAKVKTRLGLSGGVALTEEKFLSGLLFPVKLIISGVVATVTKAGQTTVTKSRTTAGYCVLTHTIPNPTTQDASAFKCFSTSSVLVDAVREYRDEDANSTVYPIDWDEAIVKTGSSCARLLAIS